MCDEILKDVELKKVENYKSITVDIVSKVSYLLGVGVEIFDNTSQTFCIKRSIFDELEENDSAKIIRTLCIIRSTMIRNFDKINPKILYELQSIDRMEDIFDVSNFRYLESKGIGIVKANRKLQDYISDVNKLITENINKCKTLFPLWLEWEYVRELFIMPKGTVPSSVKLESNRYRNNLKHYPYQVYMGWTPSKGNILYNDKKFLELLYAHYGREFEDIKRVVDASESKKKSIYNFLEENDDTVVVVDCENCDPYKLCATIKSLKEDELHKIKKIILINDIHAATMWKIFEKYISIPVEYILIERVKGDKSLVDIKVTTETCREHYVNNINSFVLCSSDSDYWGLITSLKKANFLVMIEDKKCGPDIQNAMDEWGIVYCSIDDFTDSSLNGIKVDVLKSCIYEYIGDCVQLNVNDMLEQIYSDTRISMSEKEKKQFYDNYIKGMRLSINNNGDVEIILK